MPEVGQQCSSAESLRSGLADGRSPVIMWMPVLHKNNSFKMAGGSKSDGTDNLPHNTLDHSARLEASWETTPSSSAKSQMRDTLLQVSVQDSRE